MAKADKAIDAKIGGGEDKIGAAGPDAFSEIEAGGAEAAQEIIERSRVFGRRGRKRRRAVVKGKWPVLN